MADPKRSSREQRMANYVAESPNPTTETSPDDELARRNRNWNEIKKARIIALRQRNAKGVGILDNELAAGRGEDFPHDANFDDDADLGPLAAGNDDDLGPRKQIRPSKPASQADVRKAEPPMSLIEQEAAERGFDNAQRDFTAKGGVLKPGQTQAQAVTAATGQRDPRETRQEAEAKHAIATGELPYGDSVAYNVVKPAAAVAGFTGMIPGLTAGPLGASAAEAFVRATAIGYNINAALDHGMDPDQAVQVFVRELTKGAAADTLFNFGAPLIGHLVSKIPGLNRIADKLATELAKRIPGPAPRPDLRDFRISELQGMTDNPARAKAVEELSKRVEGDFIPAPGQVTGKSGFMERRTYEAFPGDFKAQEEALQKGAEKMRQEVVQPGSQPTQQRFGEQIVRVTDETVDATKRRLKPVFEEANRLNIIADFNDVQKIARNALQKDAEVVGKGKLTEAERNHLQQIIDDTGFQPWTTAEAALDFVSIQKSMLRKLNPDGKPTPYFSTIVGDLTRAANDAFAEGARRMGKGAIVDKLMAAREDYRTMMETAYDGSIKQVLRKGEHAPEDIGRYLWSEGKVTRIDELNEMLGLAQKEGVIGSKAADKLRRNITRGFLQEAVTDLKSAASWSESLSDPAKRATWELLTQGPEGTALKNAMAVLEQAAQIATVPPVNQMSRFLSIPVSRAAGGGLGISLVTGAFSPGLAAGGLAIASLMRLMATAYTHGDKGTLNLLTKVIRTNSTATAASAKALQTMLPELSKAAEKYKVTDIFIPAEQSDQSER